MTKEELGKQIEALRKECGVSTYQLEKKGIHPSLPATIEKGLKGYTMDSLIKYLKAIDEDIFLSVGKEKRKRISSTGVADYEAQKYQNSNNLNTRTNDTRSTKTAIEYTGSQLNAVGD